MSTTQPAATAETQPTSLDAGQKGINPWLFVPVLYFMQFLPYGLVTSLFAPLYKNLGIDNLRIATWTGLAALPWTFKMFWGPLVDLNSTKRRWTLTMQACLAVTLLFTAGALATSSFFVLTVIAMFVIGTFSATHDIACDGLYLMSLDKKRQAAFSGVMAAFSRLGRLFVDSVLVVIAGRLITNGMEKQTAWVTALGLAALIYGAGCVWNFFMLPRPVADQPAADVAAGERTKNIWRTLTIVAAGVAAYYLIDGAVQLTGHALYQAIGSGKAPAKWDQTGEVWNEWGKIIAGVVLAAPLWILIRTLVRGTPMGDAFVSYVRQPGFPAILGFIVFYRFGEAMIFAMAALFIMDKHEAGGLGVSLEQLGLIKGVGQVLGLMVGGLVGGWFIAKVGLRKAFWPLVICMHVPNLLYVWAAFNLWIADRDMTIPDWPLAAGAVVLAVALGWMAVKRRFSVTPAILAALAVAGYAVARSVYGAQAVQVQHWPLYPVVFLEAVGYGVGFAGYFVFLMHVAQRGHFVTSHYAIGTGLGALFITFATILAGIVYSVGGYTGVFVTACVLTIPGTLILLFIPLDNEQTKGAKAAGGH